MVVKTSGETMDRTIGLDFMVGAENNHVSRCAQKCYHEVKMIANTNVTLAEIHNVSLPLFAAELSEQKIRRFGPRAEMATVTAGKMLSKGIGRNKKNDEKEG